MIPVVSIDAWIEDPLPECTWPRTDEIDEEGFGYFRGNWFIGRLRLDEARQMLATESKFIEYLDRVADTSAAFDCLAFALEEGSFEDVPEPLRARARVTAREEGIEESGEAALDGLEIGVAGLSYALSASGCLTAASCRSHASRMSWSDCPVVFFATPEWRIPVIAKLADHEGCGLGADREMLKIFAPSILHMNRLGNRLIRERARFRGIRPAQPRRQSASRRKVDQLSLVMDESSDSGLAK